jgi:hypothetical protein
MLSDTLRNVPTLPRRVLRIPRHRRGPCCPRHRAAQRAQQRRALRARVLRPRARYPRRLMRHRHSRAVPLPLAVTVPTAAAAVVVARVVPNETGDDARHMEREELVRREHLLRRWIGGGGGEVRTSQRRGLDDHVRLVRAREVHRVREHGAVRGRRARWARGPRIRGESHRGRTRGGSAGAVVRHHIVGGRGDRSDRGVARRGTEVVGGADGELGQYRLDLDTADGAIALFALLWRGRQARGVHAGECPFWRTAIDHEGTGRLGHM